MELPGSGAVHSLLTSRGSPDALLAQTLSTSRLLRLLRGRHFSQ